jgi:hypothetical protein
MRFEKVLIDPAFVTADNDFFLAGLNRLVKQRFISSRYSPSGICSMRCLTVQKAHPETDPWRPAVPGILHPGGGQHAGQLILTCGLGGLAGFTGKDAKFLIQPLFFLAGSLPGGGKNLVRLGPGLRHYLLYYLFGVHNRPCIKGLMDS